MRLAWITGRVAASVKASGLTGYRMLLADYVDSAGLPVERSVVIVDSCGAGPGDVVLVATGSAARIPREASAIPTDATAVAFVDHLSVGSRTVDLKTFSEHSRGKGNE